MRIHFAVREYSYKAKREQDHSALGWIGLADFFIPNTFAVLGIPGFIHPVSGPLQAWFLYQRFIWRLSNMVFVADKFDWKAKILQGQTMRNIPLAARRAALHWLSQGVSTRRLALTLALGFAIGCIPVVGIPTVICAALAIALRLNLPAIQAANYAAMPLQVALIVPFMRFGGWLVSVQPARLLASRALLHLPALSLAAHLGGLAGQALLAWLLAAIPAVALMTGMFTIMLRRIPMTNAVEAGD
jgi:uncharacterized protein (DUF2062 family)